MTMICIEARLSVDLLYRLHCRASCLCNVLGTMCNYDMNKSQMYITEGFPAHFVAGELSFMRADT